MHILVTNDDGPPQPTSSPYVHSLVRGLQKAGHTVSVCLPHSQRSWIGKAHMIGQTVKPLYYWPSETFDPRTSAAQSPQGQTSTRPRRDGAEEWILVDGTPASCAQIGLFHFFADKGPIDLVVSGPNYGRNTTALFALSSGTLGAALEAAVCRKKSIALSWAFFRDVQDSHDPAIVEAATRHSVKVIEKLYAQWPGDDSVDLYTVNVPLLQGMEASKVLFTPMLQNYWGQSGPCFEEVEGSIGDEEEEEERIREGGEAASSAEASNEGTGTTKGYTHRHFKWRPRFHDVYQSVTDSSPGNDGWAVQEGHTSVTPMKANFWQTATHLHGTELKLENEKSEHKISATSTSETNLLLRPKCQFYALINYEDPYVQPLILSAMEQLFSPGSYTLLSIPQSSEISEIQLGNLLPDINSKILQITPYEAIDWDFVASHSETCMVNSYMLRKALIRKHYLSTTVEHWVAKRPQSILKTHVKRSEAFELDYAEFLDDALIEAFDLRASLDSNEAKLSNGKGEATAKDIEWWILKPSMSDRGQGIRLFSTMEQLQGIFDEWEAELPDSDDEGGDCNEDEDSSQAALTKKGAEDSDDHDYITASHLRHFVAQPYIHPPLLLPGDNRKFHIRTYVACVGSLDVYVYRQMLTLFAAKPYTAPGSSPLSSLSSSASSPPSDAGVDLEAHLTNTCLQRSVADNTVQSFWRLPDAQLAAAKKADIFAQVCGVAGEVFEAAARGMQMHFRPLPNAFEVFGVDFLVDAAGDVWLLEVNAFPDFKQTGGELRGVVEGFWESVLRKAVRGFFGGEEGEGAKAAEEDGELVLVRQVDLGR
ncbi:5'/3'-nucleotidase sure [Xylariaceae sp. FL0016]|nr:5'/3'-nucleotidase sure [Xylariaceae sp. FL0016]